MGLSEKVSPIDLQVSSVNSQKGVSKGILKQQSSARAALAGHTSVSVHRDSGRPAAKDDSSSSGSIGSGDSGGKKQKGALTGSRWKKKAVTTWRRFSCLFISPIFLRHRNRLFILVEVILPALIGLAIIAAFTSGISWKKAYYERKDSDKSQVNPFQKVIVGEKALDYFRRNYVDRNKRVLIFFCPANNLTKDIMQNTLDALGVSAANPVDLSGKGSHGAVGLPNSLEVLEKSMFHKNHKKSHHEPIGIFFKYNEKDINVATAYPYLMKVYISTFNDSIAETQDDFPYVQPSTSNNRMSPYTASGFIGLQYALHMAYISKLLSPTSIQVDKEFEFDFDKMLSFDVGRQDEKKLVTPNDIPDIHLHMFYYPNFFNKNIRYLMSITVGGCLVSAYLLTSFFNVRQIVQENKTGIKEILRMHGMPAYMHWVILVVHCIVFRGLTAILMTVVLFLPYGNGAILQLSCKSLIFILLWAHLIVLTFFNYLLATIVKSVTLAGFYSLAVGLTTFIIPLALLRMNLLVQISHIILVTIFPNWALYNIIHNFVEFESDDQSLDWSTLHSADHINDLMLRTSVCLILMNSAGLVYLIFAVYFDMSNQTSLNPPGHRCWHIFKNSKQKLLNEQRQKELLQDIKDGKILDFPKPQVFEELDPRRKCIVRVRNLCKRYGEHVLALDNLNLNIQHNEITVILGHSGCGKSTLISILAGMTHPTTGYATIENIDVSFNSSKARRFTGLCSQELTFVDLLTVKQHVFLCYRLRGYSKLECTRHTSTLLIKLRLWSIRGFYPDKLTNDELRRLGIAIAMADAPKVLLLDGPTNGMDSFGRREIWAILKSLRKHHTIIFTTNYMDEAELLGDRVAFLSHGKLICFGSVEYLKQQYDTGYFLKLVPLPHIVSLDSEAVLAMLRARLGNHVREKKIKTREDVDAVIIELPREQLSEFGDMCDELDAQQFTLGVKKYSIKQVGLSDIFIKICESIASDKDAPDLYVRRDSIGEIKTALATQVPELPLSERFKPRLMDQMKALIIKRWIYLKTKNEFIVWKYIVPLCLMYMVVGESSIFSKSAEPPVARDFLKVYNESAGVETFYKVTKDVPAVEFKTRITTLLGISGMELLQTDAIIGKLHHVITNHTKLPKKTDGDTRRAHTIALELKPYDKAISGKKQFTGFHASGALHSAPTVLDVMMNVILSSITDQNAKPYRMHIVNDPFPDRIASDHTENCDFICVILAITLSLSYCIISASTVTFPMRERAIGIKYLQLMTGVHPAIYWLADYICDFIPMLLVTIFVGIVFYQAPNETYDDHRVIFVLLMFTAIYFLWTGPAYCYFMSTVIPLKYVGYDFVIVMHAIFGIVPFIITEYIFAKSDEGVVVLRLVFMIFPGYTITCAIQDWFEIVAKINTCASILPQIKQMCAIDNTEHNKVHVKSGGHRSTESEFYDGVMQSNIQFGRCCEKMCKSGENNRCFQPPSLLSLDHENVIHPNLISDTIALVISGFIFWTLLTIVEKRIFARLAQKIVFRLSQSKKRKSRVHSKDLKQEAMIVASILNEESFPSDIAFVVQDLTKSKTSTMIINGFNLEVKAGECVGILGSGGSGKTEIVKMMIGESIPTKGMCYIADSSLIKSRKNYLSSIGYCAQYNTLFDNFTGVQMLSLIGRLRGIPNNLLPTHVAQWLNIMGLGDVGHTRCKLYRAGMKRRLCFCMALIGNCPVIILDEVTSGVDPVARERIWAVLEHLRSIGHTVIFTSFYTQECIHLTSKLVIIAEGNVQCLGSPHDLKKRYARGFCITLRMRNDVLTPVEILSTATGRVAELKTAVENAFLHIDLLDEQDNVLLYFLRDTTRSWGDVFRTVESVTEEFTFICESYDITEASIEDLFILLTNKYKEMDNPRKSNGRSEFALAQGDPQFQAVEQAAQALHLRS